MRVKLCQLTYAYIEVRGEFIDLRFYEKEVRKRTVDREKVRFYFRKHAFHQEDKKNIPKKHYKLLSASYLAS